MSLDIVIINVPGTSSRAVPAAASVLKSAVEAHGFTCKTYDFNIRFFHETPIINQFAIESYFSSGECSDEKVITDAYQLITRWAIEIIGLAPTYLGISVFTYQNRTATELFCNYIKHNSTIKIVIGGNGLSDAQSQSDSPFGINLLDRGLIDYYIKGDGEYSLIELLKENTTFPGINATDLVQTGDIDKLPFPNFDNYNLSLYEPLLPITGSRGCIRHCSFCDVHEHSRYKYRSGQRIVEEIIALSVKYQIYEFYFTDSLINGNLKEFKIMCESLAEYNLSHEQKITWTGFFIVRGPKAHFKNYWQLIKDSGGKELRIGVETGSDSVRAHMNKKFTNLDLDYTMEMLAEYQISCMFLLVVGYPTETLEDFNQTLLMFNRYIKYANHTIIDVTIGSTLSILVGTPLYKNAADDNIELDKHENNWIAHNNPELTLIERLRRVDVLKAYLDKLGYKLNNSTEVHIQMLESSIPNFEIRNKIKKIIKIKNQV